MYEPLIHEIDPLDDEAVQCWLHGYANTIYERDHEDDTSKEAMDKNLAKEWQSKADSYGKAFLTLQIVRAINYTGKHIVAALLIIIKKLDKLIKK